MGGISREEIIEVFQRLNATKYSLLDIEVNNAVYAGALKKYAERLAAEPFFEQHNVFNALDLKRMGDLRYALTIVITFMSGYFNRDDEFGTLLARYNDDFPPESAIDHRIHKALNFIEECAFTQKSRVWRKADLFTLVVELDMELSRAAHRLQPSTVVRDLEAFYERIDTTSVSVSDVPAIYYKAALQASNDRINRVRRGVIVSGVLRQLSDQDILKELDKEGLVG